MRSIILRSLLFTAVALLVFNDLQAQRGRSHRHYRSYSYRYYPSRSIVRFSSPRVIIPFGGLSYHYYSGHFYRPFGSYFRIVAPPIGIHISILPRGYRQIYVGGFPYYYYGGTYYRRLDNKNDDYEVVDPPLGASVPELPKDAKVVVINNQKYYEYEGTYYKEDIRDNSGIWYTVVGKNGKLNTDESETEPEDNGPVVGDIVDKLPDNCKTVVLNGNKYYVSPDDVYYEETMEHNTLRYKIVGK
jgi:Family of unknown function (DUF6515)